LERSAFLALRLVVVVTATLYLARQVKKPTRFVGRLFARMMNKSHSSLTDWALGHIELDPAATVLDVGCGGGKTIQKLSRLAASIDGVDYAAGSIAESRSLNKTLISEGRVFIQQASVSSLPFPDARFELVTAIETQYYWPDVVNDMKEILRVLKPGGRLMVVAESYRGGKNDWFLGPVMRLLGSKGRSVDDHRELFQAAGYTAVQISEEQSKGWLCAIGEKPF
jgi:ubiquinone/menaquinone biosynthesis C-methylase UbiE